MSKREYRDYLNDISQSIKDVNAFIKGMNRNSFLNDRKTLNAVVRSIEIIGEASKHIPKNIRDKAPAIPWQKIVGMRNKITHEYFGVDNNIVWETAKHFLPKLGIQISKLIKED